MKTLETTTSVKRHGKLMEIKKTADLTTNIFLDIETYGGPEKPEIVSLPLDSRLKNPILIEADEQKKRKQALQNQADEWKGWALDSTKGEIVCIGVAVADQTPFCIAGDTEGDMVNNLDIFLQDYSWPTIIGHNMYEFDGLWLFRKGLKYSTLTVIDRFKSKDKLQDTMVMMYGPAWKKKISLDNMARLLGFEGKGDMDGTKVHQAYLDGRIEEIRRYCESDVDKTRKCYLKLSEYGLYS